MICIPDCPLDTRQHHRKCRLGSDKAVNRCPHRCPQFYSSLCLMRNIFWRLLQSDGMSAVNRIVETMSSLWQSDAIWRNRGQNCPGCCPLAEPLLTYHESCSVIYTWYTRSFIKVHMNLIRNTVWKLETYISDGSKTICHWTVHSRNRACLQHGSL